MQCHAVVSVLGFIIFKRDLLCVFVFFTLPYVF